VRGGAATPPSEKLLYAGVRERRTSGPSLLDESVATLPETGSGSVASGRGSRPAGLVYILGAHKSGATVLGAVLGAQPPFFYGGEIYRFPKPVWQPPDPDRKCSCGMAVMDCPFWSGVRRRAARDPELLEELRKGQLRFERWNRLPFTLFAAVFHRRELVDHELRMGRFLRCIAEEAGVVSIVESSYNPIRGWLYGRSGSTAGRVRYVHLVRDGRGFLASELAISATGTLPRRWYRLAPFVVARWWLFNGLALFFRVRGPRQYLRLRYEDLLAHPDAELARLEAFLDMDLSGIRARLRAGESIPLRHVAAGNRLRLQGELQLRSTPSPIRGLSRADRGLFWLIAGPLAIALGYRPGGAETSARPVPRADRGDS